MTPVPRRDVIVVRVTGKSDDGGGCIMSIAAAWSQPGAVNGVFSDRIISTHDRTTSMEDFYDLKGRR